VSLARFYNFQNFLDNQTFSQRNPNQLKTWACVIVSKGSHPSCERKSLSWRGKCFSICLSKSEEDLEILRWRTLSMYFRKPITGGILAVVLLLGSFIIAQEVMLLGEADIKRLNPEARDLYNKAVVSLDKVDPISAIEYLEQAAKLNPEVLELDFLLARLACDRARVTYGDESVKYYDIAEKAMELVKEQKDVNGEILQRAARKLDIIKEEKQAIPERDAKRASVGLEFLEARARLLLAQTGPTPTPTPVSPSVALSESEPGISITPGLGVSTSPAAAPGGSPTLPGRPAPAPAREAMGEVYR
jgi:hypothetical protein